MLTGKYYDEKIFTDEYHEEKILTHELNHKEEMLIDESNHRPEVSVPALTRSSEFISENIPSISNTHNNKPVQKTQSKNRKVIEDQHDYTHINN